MALSEIALAVARALLVRLVDGWVGRRLARSDSTPSAPRASGTPDGVEATAPGDRTPGAADRAPGVHDAPAGREGAPEVAPPSEVTVADATAPASAAARSGPEPATPSTADAVVRDVETRRPQDSADGSHEPHISLDVDDGWLRVGWRVPQDAELLVRVVVVRPDPERLTSTEEHLWPARSARGERRLPLPAGAAATAALGTLGPAGLFTASVHCGPVRASPASGSHARVDRGHGRS